jgi:uncharacterized protein (TIGR00369 family)
MTRRGFAIGRGACCADASLPHPATLSMSDSPSDSTAEPRYDGRARVIPFLKMIGMELAHEADGLATVALKLRPDLLNNHGGGHGGIVMALLDSAMANAALSRIDYAREVVTIDMHVAFMKPAVGDLTATGRATGGGRSVCFCEAQITDAEGTVTAKAMGTFRYRSPGPSKAGE